MNQKNRSSRRQFLTGGSAAAAGLGLTGCAPAGDQAEQPTKGGMWEAPPAQEGNNLNVILLVSDTFRADNLEAYGSDWIECPFLNSFAKDCVIFEDFYPEGMPTIPIRRTLMTGRRILPFHYYRQFEPVQLPGWHELYVEDVTMGETLTAAGYKTALLADIPHLQRPGKNFHRGYYFYEWMRGHEMDYYTTAPREMPDFTDLFPQEYLDKPEFGPAFTQFLNQWKKNRQRYLKNGEAVVEPLAKGTIRWLNENKNEGPFFLHVEAFDPHEPWDPPKRFLDKYMPNAAGPSWPEPPYADVTVPEDGVKRFRANYAGEASCLDYWFGQILRAIEDNGLFDNSIVIFMSDHGALLGEQGQFLKGPARIRGQVTHLPLLVRLPNKEHAGKRVSGFVQVPDIMPTILSRLGLKPPARVTGEDAWDLVTGANTSPRDHAVQGYGWIGAVRTKEWNFSRAASPDKLPGPYKPELYNLNDDPEELTNVAEKYPDIVAKLGQQLDDYMTSGEDLTDGNFHWVEDAPAPSQAGR